MLTLFIATLLASLAFRRISQAKGYSTNRIQFYPAVILAAVIIPARFAELFLAFAVSRQLCSEVVRAAMLTAINVLCFILYFGALSRSLLRLKNLPNLPSASIPRPKTQHISP